MKKKNNKKLLRRFVSYYKNYKGLMAFSLFCALVTALCEMTLPLIARYLTGVVQNRFEDLTLSLILIVGASYLAVRLIDTAAGYFMANQGHVMGAKMERDMRRDLFAHLETLSFDYFDNTKVGQIMSRITSDLFDVTEFAHHCPEEFFLAGVKIVTSFVILSTFDIYLTLIIFAFIPITIALGLHFRKKMRAAYTKNRHQRGEINADVEDSLLGVRVVKSFARESYEEEKFAKGNEKFLDIKKETYKYMASFASVTRMCEGIMYVAVIFFGGLFMLYLDLSVPDFVAYLLYVPTLLTSVRRIIDYTEQFQNGISGIERFYEIMDIKASIVGGEKELTAVDGNIKFENVCFSYNGNKDVLTNIDLDIKKGENVAIVGPSGGGKSTLCSLIPRFYDVTDGEITIDGVSVKDVTLKSLRENIGVVQQDVYLFSGTVLENIVYGKIGATMEEAVEAAKQAGAHEFISKLENGYDTYVGERGVKLSGGEKQRISIARVFLKDPPILILDEATSALDNESERAVQQSLERLMKGRTTLTIAHRLTTVKNASRIIVLTKDGIAEEGTHRELIEKRGFYYELYSLYACEG